MRGILKRVVSEPGADTAESFARRVRLPAVTYAVLFSASCAGVLIVALYGKLFVTLAQRSNVETLTVLFIVRNGVFGEGQIQVDFRVRPRAGGAPVLHGERATLRPHETARIEAKIDGARGDEQLDVEVDYPPR